MFKRLAAKFFSEEIKSEAVAMLGAAQTRLLSGRQSGAKWPYGLSASGAGFAIDHHTARQNARNAYQESPQAKAIVDRYADNVSGTGLRFEFQPRANLLGISPEQAEQWARNAGTRFDLWAQSKLQHRAENLTWYQTHRLYEMFRRRENDVFVRLYYDPSPRLLNPLQFEMIDASQIRGDAYTSSSGWHGGDDGIVRDERGRETVYKVWVRTSKGEYKSVDVPKYGPRGRVQMLHGYSPEYAGQGRGFSMLSHAIQEFENLTDFASAHIKKAINQSLIALYNQPGKDKPASNPFEGVLTEFGAGPAAEQFGSNPSVPSTAQNVGDIEPVSCYSVPEASFNTPGSVAVFGLDAGENLKPFTMAPADGYDTFVDAFTAYLSAAEGMPLEVLLMKFGENYSASRGALLLFWRVVEIERAEIAADYLNPTVEMWLTGEIAAGRIQAPGWSDPVMRAAWLNGVWTGSPMPNIDPLRTANADQKYIELGAQTLDMVALAHNGSDGAANRAKLAREYGELPIAPWSKPSGSR